MIRQATAADFEQVLELVYGWWLENTDSGWPEPTPAGVAEALAQTIVNPAQMFLVADCGSGKLGGMLCGFVQPFFWSPQTLQAVIQLLRCVGEHEVLNSLVREFHRRVDGRVIEVSFTLSSGYREDVMVRYMRRFGYKRIGTDLRRQVCVSASTSDT